MGGGVYFNFWKELKKQGWILVYRKKYIEKIVELRYKDKSDIMSNVTKSR